MADVVTLSLEGKRSRRQFLSVLATAEPSSGNTAGELLFIFPYEPHRAAVATDPTPNERLQKSARVRKC